MAGESLFNDGIGVVVFLVLLEIASGAGSLGVSGVAWLFAREAVGGALLGLALGLVAFYMLKRVNNYQVEVLLTIALAMGVYALADSVHISAPIAVVVAGLLIGNPGRSLAMSAVTKEHVDTFWELIDEILNAVLFLLIGLEVLVMPLSWVDFVAAGVAIPIVLLARWLSVAAVIVPMRHVGNFAPGTIAILTWGGSARRDLGGAGAVAQFRYRRRPAHHPGDHVWRGDLLDRRPGSDGRPGCAPLRQRRLPGNSRNRFGRCACHWRRRNTSSGGWLIMKILILGGTGFFGPHLVDAALAKHEVTLFNRGKTHAELFPDLEKLRGDRDPNKGEGLHALQGRSWDAWIDNSGYVPRIVSASAELAAKSAAKQYVFISSISAFAEDAMNKGDVDETSPVATIADPTVEEMGDHFENYGPLKALCEQAAEKAMPGHTTNIRPGLIVGPGDPTDRYTYWPVRIDHGGEVLAPNCPEMPVQYIDVRDLAEWTVRMVEDGHVGIYDALGPANPLSWTAFLYGIRGATTSDAHFTWVDEAFLLQNQVGPWMELPLWIPNDGNANANQASNDKAIAVGLTFRPVAVTAKDTLDWFKQKWPKGRKLRGGAGLRRRKRLRFLPRGMRKRVTRPRRRHRRDPNERGFACRSSSSAAPASTDHRWSMRCSRRNTR